MKVAVLGAGGFGRTLVLEFASDRRVSDIVVLDMRGDRSRTLQSIGRTARVTALEVDVRDPASLGRALEGVDVAVNATLPDYNLAIMRVCFEAGCGYVDSSGYSPNTPEEKWGVLEQLELDPAWQQRGIAAIVGMGSDPGISNVMARVAADRFQSIDAIRIRWGASGKKEVEGFPLYSREMFIRDALSRPMVWDRGQLIERDVASGEEEFEFPPPIGRRKVHLFEHEETMTLPRRLGKPVASIDYKHSIDPSLVRAIWHLNALGLLSPKRAIRIGPHTLRFRDAFMAAWPEPSTLIGPMEGSMSLVIEVDGTKADGSKASVRIWTLIDHKEANRRRGTTAEYFLTAASAATGALLIGLKKTPRLGVLSPEELPPDVVLPELEQRGVHFNVVEHSIPSRGGTPATHATPKA